MDKTFRQIIRHAAVFGIGAMLSRLASVLLLPLYTRYLSPSDYGIIAIIDLTIGLLSIAGSAGVASAATREHFKSESKTHIAAVWWTALAGGTGASLIVLIPAFALRHQIAMQAFGGEVQAGSHYFSLAILTLWFGLLINVLESYFRVQKASVFLVVISLGRLLLNIALNVLLLTVFRLGVEAVLLGNLIAAAVVFIVEALAYLREHPRPVIWRRLVMPYWQFGWPIVVFGLLSSIMHEADRYVLRVYSNLNTVGLYSIAYQIGQGVNTLAIVPFTMIWSVLVYEAAREPDAPAIYARVFKHFVSGLALILLIASLFAGPMLRLIAPPEYWSAAGIVPIVCLAYLFFSLHDHFKVPALVSNETVALLPVVACAAALNIVGNLIVVPRFGGYGAAWVSVATFAVFSGVGLLRYRRIATYPYPFASLTMLILGMVASYLAHRTLTLHARPMVEIASAVVLTAAWLAFVYGRIVSDLAANTDVWQRFYRPRRAGIPIGVSEPGASAVSGSALPANEPQ